jgi:uncharacterized membrane protein
MESTTKKSKGSFGNQAEGSPINSTSPTNEITEWPGAFGIYRTSKAAMMRNFKTFIRLAIIFGVFYLLYGIVSYTPRYQRVVHPVAHLIESIIFDLISVFLSSIIIYATIRSAKGEQISIGEAFSSVANKALNIVITGIFVSILSLVSFVLFIIPAFFVIPRISMSLYFVVDKNMSPIDAIKASWEVTRDNIGKVYGIFGVNLLILLPIITLIGVFATAYFGFMYFAATAILYIYLTKNQKTKTIQS